MKRWLNLTAAMAMTLAGVSVSLAQDGTAAQGGDPSVPVVPPPAPQQVDPAPSDLLAESATQTPATPLHAAIVDASKLWRVTFYLENDSGFLKPNHPTDRWYTNGMLLSITHQPKWAQELLPSLPFAQDFGPAKAAVGYHGGQLIFTPRNIVSTLPQHGDRPFAGYLYGGLFLQRSNDITLDHFQVDVGIVGPSSLAEDAQKLIHRNFWGDDPNGWDNQMRDEPTVQAYLRKKWRLPIGNIPFGQDDDSPVLSFQMIPEAGVALGTVYRHLEAGVTFRAGFMLPDDFGPGYIHNLPSATDAVIDGWSGYVFAGLAGKAVEHNLFLDGSDFRSNRVDVNHQPLVGQGSLGIVINYRKDNVSFDFSYSQIYMTSEFRGNSGSHGYGAVRGSLSFLF